MQYAVIIFDIVNNLLFKKVGYAPMPRGSGHQI